MKIQTSKNAMLTPATVGKKEQGFMCKLADLLVPLQIMVNIFLKGEIMSCGASLGSH